MFCSTCGAETVEGLHYCNRCGAKLHQPVIGLRLGRADLAVGGKVIEPGHGAIDFVVWAMVATFVFGTGVTMGLMAVMKGVVGFNDGIVAALTIFCFIMMVAIEAILTLLLFRRTRRPEGVVDTAPIGERAGESKARDAVALPPVMPSVTEHTTRTIDPAYVREAESGKLG
jgi:hypothetical protein